MVAVLYTRLVGRGTGAAGGFVEPAEGEQALIELHGELMKVIVLPYLGAAVAAQGDAAAQRRRLRESASPTPARPVGRVPSGRTRGSSDLSHGARAQGDRQATRRGNREVAERAGIVNQGQLEGNASRAWSIRAWWPSAAGASAARGKHPNSWWLTERGEALEREVGHPPLGEQVPGSPRWGKESSSWQRQTSTVASLHKAIQAPGSMSTHSGGADVQGTDSGNART